MKGAHGTAVSDGVVATAIVMVEQRLAKRGMERRGRIGLMPSDDTLRRWVQDAARGDVPALQKLLLVHHERLREVAADRLGGALRPKIAPEDILQEVYIEVVQRVGEFEDRGPDSFLNFLLTILESRLVDVHRRFEAAKRDVRREIRSAGVASRWEPLAARIGLDSRTPSRILATKEAEALLFAAMAGLSEDHRRVLELRYIRGLALADVGREMNRSVAAVQMLALRALRRLREMLESLSRVGL